MKRGTARNGAPPFVVEVRMPFPAHDIDVDLNVKAAKGAELDDTAEVLSYFFGALQAGAFCSEGASPAESTFEMTASETTQEGGYSVRGMARNVAPGSWRILLNMLAQTHYKLDPLSEVRLVGTSKNNRGLADMASVLAHSYPTRAQEIPFPVEMSEHLSESSQFVVRIEFGGEVEDALLQAAEESFLDWGSIVYVGGFYDDFAEMQEPQLDPTETYRASPTSIEHLVRAWNAPLVALESLVNVVVNFHSNWPVVHMEIE